MTNGYLAKRGFEKYLLNEIGTPEAQYNDLFLAPPHPALWALNVWHNVQEVSFTSISEAAKILKSQGRNWALYPNAAFRRSQLIQEKLPHISFKPLNFGDPLPSAPLGSWTLLDNNRLLFSSECSSPFANGVPTFVESPIPPSRAYLKLYEALTYYGTFPQKGEKVLEVGASPGSWTWVLKQTGCDVTACDRAPLEIKHDNFIQGDAFSLTPDKIGPVDWLVSDLICYPEKLLEWVLLWLNHAKHFILTIKLQGEYKPEIVQKFQELGEVRHLYHNKHELTFLRSPNDSPVA